jgi:hypothetical protein
MTDELARKLWRLVSEFERDAEAKARLADELEPRGRTFEHGYVLACETACARCGRSLRHALEDAGIQRPEDL